MNMHDTTVKKAEGSGGPVARPRPKLVRWFIIVGLLLALVVGAVIGFNVFLTNFLKGLFANMAANPPPVTVSVASAKKEVIPHLLTSVGELVAVRQVNVTADAAGRVTAILFEAGAEVKKDSPLVQLFDDPDRSDLASFKAQLVSAQLTLDRGKALVAKQAGTQATVDTSQAAYDQAAAAVQKTEAIISQKLVKAPFDGALGVRMVNLGQYLSAGTQIVSLTDLSELFSNFTATEKDSAILKVGQPVRVSVDAYPGKVFDGKITTIEPQINTDTRNIRIQATIANPGHVLKPGMFARTTVVLPDEAAVITLPETAIDYTLYGDSVYAIKETKSDDGKTSLHAERTFVKTGARVDGRTVVVSGVNEGDRVVSLGQVKLQPGAGVVISDDPQPVVPAQPARN